MPGPALQQLFALKKLLQILLVWHDWEQQLLTLDCQVIQLAAHRNALQLQWVIIS